MILLNNEFRIAGIINFIPGEEVPLILPETITNEIVMKAFKKISENDIKE